VKSMVAAVILGVAFAVTPVAAQNARWDSGKTHFEKKEYRQAIVDFQEVADATPDFANTYYYLGMSHYLLKEYSKAINDFVRYTTLIEKEGKKPEVRARAALGRAYLFTQDYTKAASALAAVIQTATDDATNFYYLAAAYQQLKKPEKAVDALAAGLKYFPRNADMLDLSTRLLLDRAIASKSASDFQAAIARGEQLRLARDDAESATLLASAYLASGDYGKAAVHYARVVADKPTDGASWFNYGLSLSRSNQAAKAEPALTKASELMADSPAVWAELGYVQETLKNYPKALLAYEKAYKLTPDPSIQESIDRVKPFAN
jgi:tetratricopeptide (TPR) repeat protein